MMSIFDKWGVRHPTTVLQLDSCQVVQAKTDDTNGYTALQLGVGEAKAKRVKISAKGHFDKAGVVPKRSLQEFRVSPDCLLPVGTQIHAVHFVPGQKVDVCSTSKGKGFQGVMKRWNFSGGRASHGASVSHRIPGSTGMRGDPGRVFKNKKMPGRMGSERTTMQNLTVLRIDPVRELVYVKGSVPGNAGVFCRIVDAVKGPFYPSPPPTPTFPLKKGQEGFPTDILYAPAGEADPGIVKEPDEVL